MTRFWLVRHGPTHARGIVGWTDLPADLSDRAAIARLAGHLPPDAPVISSDLSRAVATADALAGGRLRLPHDPALREVHFGAWEGLIWDEVPDQALARAFWDGGGDIRAPGGESWNALCGRVLGALDRLQGRAADVIVVCHFGPIVAALQHAEGTSPEAAFGHRIDNLSVTCLAFDPPHVGAINHVP